MQDTCSNLDFIHCCARFCFQLHLQNLTQNVILKKLYSKGWLKSQKCNLAAYKFWVCFRRKNYSTKKDWKRWWIEPFDKYTKDL